MCLAGPVIAKQDQPALGFAGELAGFDVGSLDTTHLGIEGLEGFVGKCSQIAHLEQFGSGAMFAFDEFAGTGDEHPEARMAVRD